MTTRRRIAALAFAALCPLAASAEPGPDPLKGLAVDELKALYLACNDAALAGLLAAGQVALCSLIYEDLKRRAFGGDFERLLAWSRAQPSRVGAVEKLPR